MQDEDIRGTFMGYHVVLGALVMSHPDLQSFKRALDEHSTALLRASEAKPAPALLHPAESVVEMFDQMVLRLQRQRGTG